MPAVDGIVAITLRASCFLRKLRRSSTSLQHLISDWPHNVRGGDGACQNAGIACIRSRSITCIIVAIVATLLTFTIGAVKVIYDCSQQRKYYSLCSQAAVLFT